jgi:sphinganine-1-phosphate aldolase
VRRLLGVDGYRALARQARAATEILARSVAAIDGLRVVGTPVTTLVAVAQDGPDGVDVLNLADEMTARGWLLQPQPPFAQAGGADLPATLHLTVTGATAGRVNALLTDLGDAARAAAALPRPAADPALVAALPRPVAERLLAGVLDLVYRPAAVER